MESGTSSFRRRGRGLLFGLVSLFVVTSASAQQPANGTSSSTPAGLPAAQPLSQAAVNASGATPAQAKTGDAAKDSPDQTAMVQPVSET
jgi:hypothetical protein